MAPANLPTLVELDEDAALSFLQGAVQAQSITGNETNFVRYLEPVMQSLGLFPKVEAFESDRLNIWGETESNPEPGAKTLLIVGHTDTVHVKGWSEKWADTLRENPFSGAIVEGEIWGRGSGDLKAGICSWLMAWKLLRDSGLKLDGKLQFAFVGDEESGEPGMGVSAGIRHYISNVAPGLHKPDFAIYTEPSQLKIFSAQMGFFIADVTISGKTSYFGMPEKGIDALKAAHKVAGALFEHSEVISQHYHHDLVGKPFALITDFSAGGYIAVPGNARLSLIRKLSPQEDMDLAVAELRSVIMAACDGTGCTVNIEFTAGRDHEAGGLASVTDPDLTEIGLLQHCLKVQWNSGGAIQAAPFWSEKSFLNHNLGCNAIYCAPGDISNCHTLEERVDMKEYVAAIRAFAAFIAAYCGASEHQASKL